MHLHRLFSRRNQTLPFHVMTTWITSVLPGLLTPLIPFTLNSSKFLLGFFSNILNKRMVLSSYVVIFLKKSSRIPLVVRSSRELWAYLFLIHLILLIFSSISKLVRKSNSVTTLVRWSWWNKQTRVVTLKLSVKFIGISNCISKNDNLSTLISDWQKFSCWVEFDCRNDVFYKRKLEVDFPCRIIPSFTDEGSSPKTWLSFHFIFSWFRVSI